MMSASTETQVADLLTNGGIEQQQSEEGPQEQNVLPRPVEENGVAAAHDEETPEQEVVQTATGGEDRREGGEGGGGGVRRMSKWGSIFKREERSEEERRSQSHQGTIRAAAFAAKMAGRVKRQTETLGFFKGLMEKGNVENLVLHRKPKRLMQRPLSWEESPKLQKTPFLIFHPLSTWRLVWDILILVVLMYSLVTIPLRLAFDNNDGCNKDFWKQSLMFYYDLFIDCMFITDILIHFRTAIIVEERSDGGVRIACDWKLIASRYCTRFFLIDCAAATPLDLIMLPYCENKLYGFNKLLRGPIILRMIRITRLARIVRVTRVRRFFTHVRDVLRIHPGIVRVFLFITTVILFVHWNACIYYFIGYSSILEELSVENGQPTFEDLAGLSSFADEISFISHFHFQVGGGADAYQTIWDMTWDQQYLVVMYWSTTTMTTVGFGDIHPKNTYEALFTMLVLLEAGIAFSYMVGNMATLLSKVHVRHMRYKESMEHWENFMHREKVHPDLVTRIRSYKRYLYQHPIAKLPDFARQGLSKTLLRDITAHLYREVLHSLPMFKGLDEACITELALALQPLQLPPDTVIYREDEIGDSMYFVSEGEVRLSMIMVSAQKKKELGLRVVTDTKLSDAVSLSSDRKGKHFFQMRPCTSSVSYAWNQPATPLDTGEIGGKGWEPQSFEWSVNLQRSFNYFGEGCLLSTKGQRLATAVTKSWCMVFRLDKAALQAVASKFGVMRQVYRRIRNSSANRLLRAARMLVYGRRAAWTMTSKLYVHVERGVNMPKMDRFLGLCDAYVAMRLGFPEPSTKEFQTLVQYNKLDPTWNETFVDRKSVV